jgi:hypothetical protein
MGWGPRALGFTPFIAFQQLRFAAEQQYVQEEPPATVLRRLDILNERRAIYLMQSAQNRQAEERQYTHYHQSLVVAASRYE